MRRHYFLPFLFSLSARADDFHNQLPILTQNFAHHDNCDKVDLMLLVDTTSSMSNEMTLVQGQAASLAAGLYKNIPDLRVAVASVQDFPEICAEPDDRPYTLVTDFSSDPLYAIAGIGALKEGFGCDLPEAYPYALRMAANASWRDDAKRFVVLFADAPARSGEELQESLHDAPYTLLPIITKSDGREFWSQYVPKLYTLSSTTDVGHVILDAVQKNCRNDYS